MDSKLQEKTSHQPTVEALVAAINRTLTLDGKVLIRINDKKELEQWRRTLYPR